MTPHQQDHPATQDVHIQLSQKLLIKWSPLRQGAAWNVCCIWHGVIVCKAQPDFYKTQMTSHQNSWNYWEIRRVESRYLHSVFLFIVVLQFLLYLLLQLFLFFLIFFYPFIVILRLAKQVLNMEPSLPWNSWSSCLNLLIESMSGM